MATQEPCYLMQHLLLQIFWMALCWDICPSGVSFQIHVFLHHWGFGNNVSAIWDNQYSSASVCVSCLGLLPWFIPLCFSHSKYSMSIWNHQKRYLKDMPICSFVRCTSCRLVRQNLLCIQIGLRQGSYRCVWLKEWVNNKKKTLKCKYSNYLLGKNLC